MPFTLIKGTFEPSFGSPDGDSIRFVPDDPDPLFRLRRRGRPPKINSNNGSIQLRYEGIDTMEKAARTPFSSDATDANLDLCGTNGGNNSARGHVFSNQIGPNGRLIALVCAGDAPEDDGSEIFLDVNRVKESVNFKLIEQGHAYPLFYDTFFSDLREAFKAAVEEARGRGENVWSADATTAGAQWPNGNRPLRDMVPIFPKLWRRIDTYVRDEDFFDDQRPLANLPDYIESERPERVLILSEQRMTGFDDVVTTTDTTVKLEFLPEDLIVISVT